MDRTESLAISILARSWDEVLIEIYNAGNCVKLYQDLFNRFLDEESELAFSIQIFRVRHS
jgi:hypothetical protein